MIRMRVLSKKWAILVLVCFAVLFIAGSLYLYFSIQKARYQTSPPKNTAVQTDQTTVSRDADAPPPPPMYTFSGKVVSVEKGSLTAQDMSLDGKPSGKVYTILILPETLFMKKDKDIKSGMVKISSVPFNGKTIPIRSGQNVSVFTENALSVDTPAKARQIIY